ncbi:MAG: M50 family metallopeptidase [Cytophagales bacterium]
MCKHLISFGRTLLFLWCNLLLYAILHEGGHALAIMMCGGRVETFYIDWWTGVNSYVRGSIKNIFIYAAGSLGGLLGCYVVYTTVLFLWFRKKQVPWDKVLKRPFQLFDLLLAENFPKHDFYAWLFVIVTGYYLHFHQILYAAFPGLKSVFPFRYTGGDGTNIWDILTSSRLLKFEMFRIGGVINYIGLGWILWKAKQTIQAYRLQSQARLGTNGASGQQEDVSSKNCPDCGCHAQGG